MNTEHNVTENQNLGIIEGLEISKSPVWKVAEVSSRGLITTSGRLKVNSLAAVVAIIIADYSNRPVDWIITYEGVVVATVHIDDSVTYP
jgi:hypothetical protein